MTRYLRLYALALALVACLNAQSSHVQQLYYSSTLLQYVCDAPASVTETSVNKADASLTNIVVLSNVGTVTTASAHNLWVGAMVTVSGSATTALNGTYNIATVPSTTTYTIATSGVSNATYTTGLSIATNSPLLNSAVWYVGVLHYTSTVLDGTYPGGGALSIAYRAKCSDRTTY